MLVALVMETLDGRLVDRAVHPLDLTIGLGGRALDEAWESLGEPVLDVVRLEDHVEAHLTRPDGVTVAQPLGKLDAIFGQDRVDSVRHDFKRVFKKCSCRSLISLVDRGDRGFNRAVDDGEQPELTFGSLNLAISM